MNLLHSDCFPFRFRDGSTQVLPLSKVCDPEIIDFALPRADFQGAAYQLVIGVLQAVFAPQDDEDWEEYFDEAPNQQDLQQAFETIEHAFNLAGDGPLFMQDFESLDDQKPTTVAGLLIEAPGANGIKQNTDHFIKRGVGEVMSLEMAAIALFTLQINAPSGGSGHRVGLRGGGPLTTLILPNHEGASLWQKLWLNVINREAWQYEEPDFHDGSVFPWLAPTRESSKKGTEIHPNMVHPLHMYWAMPRRIRLLVNEKEAECQISNRIASFTVTDYQTRNYGGNYSDKWESHPFTPYKWDAKKPESDRLSIKGQPGGINYKTWHFLSFTNISAGHQCAKVVDHYYKIARMCELGERPRLWVFGYDMDNMKARGWYSIAMPLFSTEEATVTDVANEVIRFQDVADAALKVMRSQIKAAWFGTTVDEKTKKEKEKKVSGDLSFIDLSFWHQTESAFFVAVENILHQAKQGETITHQQAKAWFSQLRHTCLNIFDEYALSDLGEERSIANRVKARITLESALNGYKNKVINTFKKDYLKDEKETD